MNTNLADRILVHPLLTRIVKRIAVVENTCAYGPHNIPYYADGLPGIMYVKSEQNVWLNNYIKLPELFLYGQTVAPIELSFTAPYRLIIFYLHPTAITALAGNASEITDGCIDVAEIFGIGTQKALEQLHDSTSAANQAAIISELLLSNVLQRAAFIDNKMEYAVSLLSNPACTEKIRDVCRDIGLSERTFERRFTASVGLTPKLFERICRYNTSMQQLQAMRYSKLSDIAYLNGFVDQSHFIRSFREFTGTTPRQFLAIERRMGSILM